MNLDESDVLILKMLQIDSRLSLTEIGSKVGFSRFAVKNRIEKLSESHVILGPTVIVNPILVGLSKTVFFELKTNPHEPWLAKLFEETSSCDLLDGIAGEYSLFARLRFIDDAHFSQFLKRIDNSMGKSFFKKYRVVNAIRIFKESGVPLKANDGKASKLDQTDQTILEILLNQPNYMKTPMPLSTMELSRKLRNFGVEISQPAVFQRLTRLERKGIILRHMLRMNDSALGLQAKFIAKIKANPNVYDAVAQEFLASMPEIRDLYRTGEEYGLLATLRVRDVSEYNSFLLRLYGSKDIIDTYTTLVLEERKNSPLSFKRLE